MFQFTHQDAEILNHNGECLAKISEGMLDVRRPEKLGRPSNVSATAANLAKQFAAWYFEHGCASSSIQDSDMEERFGVSPSLPKIPKVSVSPFGMIEHTEKFEDEDGKESAETFYSVYCNGQIVRVGWVRANSVQWAYPKHLADTRKTLASTRAKGAKEVFDIVCGSFSGNFRSRTANPAPKPKDASKVAPKAPTKAPKVPDAPKRRLPKAKASGK